MSEIIYYMFRSRNKDNKNIEGFKERSKIYLLESNGHNLPDFNSVDEAYKRFVKEGLPGEQSRLYVAANQRYAEVIQKRLIAKLALESVNITNIQKVVNSIAMETECRTTSYWVIDFDCTDVEVLQNFVKLINDVSAHATHERSLVIAIQTTPHGYAIITEHGFDTRPLEKEFGINVDYTIMRDNLIFRDMRTPENADIKVDFYKEYTYLYDGSFEWDKIKEDRLKLDEMLQNKNPEYDDYTL